MAARRGSQAPGRRRGSGQHFLVDRDAITRLLARLGLTAGELVVDVGAGRGALTLPLARAGARVLAIERDPRLMRGLQRELERHGLAGRVRLRRADFRDVALPQRPYRVVANPPFGLTTMLLSRLLDDPGRGPWRADLLLQRDVARTRARTPPASLRAAAWAPWWRFELGELVPRQAFRPPPAVDAAWLTVHRRDPPVLPSALAPGFAELLRPAWVATEGRAEPGRHSRPRPPGA